VISFIAFSLRRAWQGFWRNGVMSVAATATMVLMLLLLAGFWIVQTGLSAGIEYVEQKVQVVAELQDDVSDADISALRVQISAMPEVAQVDYISKDQAAATSRRARPRPAGPT